MIKVIAFLACLFPFASLAQTAEDFKAQMKSMETATNLGTLLASEKTCDLTYDQEAIRQWIDQNVEPSDLGFPSTLALMTQGFEIQLSSMSESAKSAHCQSVMRAAQHHGFTG
jgi:hypothetical protein